MGKSAGSTTTGEPAEHRRRFGHMLAEALAASGRTQEDLAGLVGATQSSVSAWVTGRYEPSAPMVFAIERALAVAPGHLSRALGYLPLEAATASPAVEDAIAQSPLIDDDQKRIVLAVYRAVVDTGPHRHRVQRRPERRTG